MAVYYLPCLLLLCIFHPPRLHSTALATQTENDFSYMRIVSDSNDQPPISFHDYIIIGGGTAGCPLAATLSQSQHSVLLLERGSSPLSYPTVLRQDGFIPNLLTPDDGAGPVEPFTSLDGVPNARGRILGGSSMINAGFYSRGEDEFFEKNSGVDWEMGEVERAYEWVEESVVYESGVVKWQGVVREAMVEAGIGPENGFSLRHVVGTKISGSTFDETGKRHGAVELLNKGDFGKLRVVVRASVERILFSPMVSGPRAIGVKYRDTLGRPHRAFLHPKGEVILSAGTLGSPQLLLLSGVGPTHHVGKFISDNPRNNIAIISPSPLNPSPLQTVGIAPDFYIESTSLVSPFVSAQKPSSLLGARPSPPLNLTLAIISAKVPGPASTGSLTLASPDVRVSPNVRFNYFSEAADLSRCVKAMRKVGDMLWTEALAPFRFDKGLGGEAGFKILGASLPEDYRWNDGAVEEFCRSTVTTWWHYHGGCRVGKVVDGEFRVMGIEGLRVVDASVFNGSPGTNPQATIMMMGRYVGLKMLRQRN